MPPVPPANQPPFFQRRGWTFNRYFSGVLYVPLPGVFFLTLLLSLSVVLALELDSWAVCPWHVFFVAFLPFAAQTDRQLQQGRIGWERQWRESRWRVVVQTVREGNVLLFCDFFMDLRALCEINLLVLFFRLYELKRKLAILLFSEREIYSQVVNQPSNNNKVSKITLAKSYPSCHMLPLLRFFASPNLLLNNVSANKKRMQWKHTHFNHSESFDQFSSILPFSRKTFPLFNQHFWSFFF